MGGTRKLSVAFVFLMGVMVTGCLGRSPMPSHYLLSQQDSGQGLIAGASRSGSMVLAPIQLPEYLDDNRIALRTGDNQVAYQDFHRWAEPLGSGTYRIMLQALRSDLPGWTIYSWEDGPLGTDILNVEVRRFEGIAENRVILEAAWTLRSADENGIYHAVRVQEFSLQKNVASGFPAMAGGMSELLHEMSREISATLAGS